MKTVRLVGTRDNMAASDLSDILPEDVEEKVKEAAEISMGTEISDEDIMNIQALCEEVLSINEYRTHLSDYLKARMLAMAPNLTVLVGETIGARLIAHSGSLVNLAKQPASTVQILGKFKLITFSPIFYLHTMMIKKVWFRLNKYHSYQIFQFLMIRPWLSEHIILQIFERSQQYSINAY